MRRFLAVLFAVPLFSHAANQAVLTWTYDMTAWPGAAFNVYQGEQGQAKVKTHTGMTSFTTTVSTGLVTGKIYCWQVAAVVSGVETDPSAEACKPFPPSPSLTVK